MIGEGCAVSGVGPSWLRPLGVFSRVAPTGAAAAFTELLGALPTAGIRAPRPAALSPERPYADCGAPPSVVR
ncbi:hypothetical protein ACFWRV_09485 [Streptomyces sp. NPDC058576]|uniref:hypothetical protein n=1 Tax=Streptomyces sp. NPDC058576 TaxID=3346547 RepID=UPI003649814A